MRFLFASTAGQGHLRPLLPFLEAARTAGHDVALLAEASVARDGVPLLELPVVPDLEERTRLAEQASTLPPYEADKVVVTQIFGRINTAATLPAAVDHVRDWRPHLVVHESASASGRLAAEVHGVPTVAVHPSLPSLVHFLDFLTDGTAELRADLGLPPDDSRMRSGAHATFFPAGLEIPGVDHPEVRRFRDAHPRSSRTGGAYVTLGTEARHMPFFQDVLGAVVRGTCASGIEHVLASTGGPTEVDGMPQQARVVPWVDQREVLIDARVLVCHGGAGTVLAGLTAGVPLVVVPLFADQFANAERVEAVGAGVRVDLGPELDARVRDAVERALPLQSAVSDEIAELPTAESAVPWFDELADG